MEKWKKVAIIAALVVIVYLAVKHFNKKSVIDTKQLSASDPKNNTGTVPPPVENLTVNPSDFSPSNLQ